jgi:glutamate dehydrogenase/leucine dehydrogenase
MKPHDPELVLEIDLEQYGTKAFLVIDRLVGGTSWGGLRIIPDPSKEETIAAARTMTYKYGFIGYMMGGAKAALQLPEELESQRKSVLVELGKKLSGVMWSGRWSPALDMGCRIEDLENLYQGAGIEKDVSSWTYGSGVYTAWSVFLSTVAALQLHGETLKGKRFVVQGMGRVGTEYCRMMSQAGAKLVGLSTLQGAIACEDGFDVEEIVQLRRSKGDGFLLEYGKGQPVDPQSVLELEAEIVVPSARGWAINEGNWNRIRGAIIPCAANAAMDLDVERKLRQNGRLVVPDFVANCGGVFGSILERYLQPSAIYHLLETHYFRKVTKLLQQSLDEERSVADIAIEESIEKLNRLDSLRERALQSIGKRILPFIPNVIRQPALLRYCSMRFFTH